MAEVKSYLKSEVAIAALLRAKECFLSSDWISSTILAGAAQQVLRDLCISRGIDTTIGKVSSSLGYNVRDIHNLVASAYNDMKHAERDPEALVLISSEEPKSLIVLAVADLARLNFPCSDEVGEILNFAKSFKLE